MRGFSLVEVVIVMIILWLILSSTVFMGSEYLQTVQTKKDKEWLTSFVQYALSYTKSTNYFNREEFSFMDIYLLPTGAYSLVVSDVSTGVFDTLDLQHTVLSFTGDNPIIRLTPYARDCELFWSEDTSLPFTLISEINSDRYCFERDFTVCKLLYQTCE